MTARPAWKLTEAVQRTGASRSTLRRYLDAGKFPNAYKDTSNTWRFPVEDLLAAGLRVSEPPKERTLGTSTERALSTSNEHPNPAAAEQVSKLEQALREERTRADNAERLAASYLDNVHDLRRAMLMLEAGISRPEQVTEQAQSVVSEQPAQTDELPLEPPTVPLSKPKPAPLRALRRLLGR